MIRNKLKIKIIRKSSKNDLKDVLNLEKKCFPKDWQFDDADKYFKKCLEEKENINLFLIKNKRRVGYLLAVPLHTVYNELAKHDKKLKNKKKCYYLETIEILKDFQGKGGATKMILAMCNEAERRGICNFSVHARVINKLNDKIKNIFGKKVKQTRKILKWYYANNEPYEFIYWHY